MYYIKADNILHEINGSTISATPPTPPTLPSFDMKAKIPRPVPTSYPVTSFLALARDNIFNIRLKLSFFRQHCSAFRHLRFRFSVWKLSKTKEQVKCIVQPRTLSSYHEFERIKFPPNHNKWICVSKSPKDSFLTIVVFCPSSIPSFQFFRNLSFARSEYELKSRQQTWRHQCKHALRLCKISPKRSETLRFLKFLDPKVVSKFEDRNSRQGYSNKYISPDDFLASLKACWPGICFHDDRVPIAWHYSTHFSFFDRPLDSLLFLNIPFQTVTHPENPYNVFDFLHFCWRQFLRYHIPLFILTSVRSLSFCSKLIAAFKREDKACILRLSKKMIFQNPANSITRPSPQRNAFIIFGARFVHATLENATNGSFDKAKLLRLVEWHPDVKLIPESSQVPNWEVVYGDVHRKVQKRNEMFESRQISNLNFLNSQIRKAFFVPFTPTETQTFKSSLASYEKEFHKLPFADIVSHFRLIGKNKESEFVTVPAATLQDWDLKNANKKRTSYKSKEMCPNCQSPGHSECPWLIPRAYLSNIYQQRLWDFVTTLETQDSGFCSYTKTAREMRADLQFLLKKRTQFWDRFSSFSGIDRKTLPTVNNRRYFRDRHDPKSGILNQIDLWWAAGCNRVSLASLIDGAPLFPNSSYKNQRLVQQRYAIDPQAFPLLQAQLSLDLQAHKIIPIPQEYSQICCNRFLVDWEEDTLRHLRVIFDARIFNYFLDYIKFRLPSFKDVMFRFGPDAKVFSVDLKSAYNQIPIMTASMRYCTFRIPSGNGDFKYFAYTSLPFGVSSAPRVFFTLIKDSILRFLHKNGWVEEGCAVAFLDDILIKVGGPETSNGEATSRMNAIIAFIGEMGFLLNGKGSQGVTTCIQWCGMYYDFTDFEIYPGENRFNNCMAALREILKAPSISVKKVESFQSKLGSWGTTSTKFKTAVCTECSSIVKYHKLQNPYLSPKDLDKSKKSSLVNISRLKYLLQIFLDILAFKSTKLALADPWGANTLVVASDASAVGLGITYRFGGQVHNLISIPFAQSDIKANLDSTLRELMGTQSAFLRLIDMIHNGDFPNISGCRYITDNKSTIHQLNSGKAGTPEVQNVLDHTLLLSDLINIPFSFHWSRRNSVFMQTADACSRIPNNKIFKMKYLRNAFFELTGLEISSPFSDNEIFTMDPFLTPSAVSVKLESWNPRTQPVCIIPYFQNTNLDNVLQVLAQFKGFGCIVAPSFYIHRCISALLRFPWKRIDGPFPVSKIGLEILYEFRRKLQSYKPLVFFFDFRIRSHLSAVCLGQRATKRSSDIEASL